MIEKQKKTVVEAPVTSAVVMEDRAQVTRQAVLELSAGQHLLHVEPITPLASDRSLRCRLEAQQGGDASRVLDLQVRRRYVVRTHRPEQERELRAEMETLAGEYGEVLDREIGRAHV